MAHFITLCHLLLVLATLDLGSRWHLSSEAIVVDGTQKGPSALMNQSSAEEMLDSYNTPTCGYSDPDYRKSDFVNAAKPGQFPWLASLQLMPGCDYMRRLGYNSRRSACMGSFISEYWIMTAAHCFAHAEQNACVEQGQMRAFAGSTNLYGPNNVNLTIRRVYVHKLYNDSIKVGFDIALIELAKPVKLELRHEGDGPQINNLCLPIEGKEFKEGQAVKIAGWGRTEHGNDQSMPDNLLTTDLYLTSAEKCAEIFSTDRNGIKGTKEIKVQYDKYKDFICADYHGKRDACQGDSGSPMLEYADGKAVAIGIVSFGMGCAKEGYPGIYERVSSLMPWIKDITQNKEKAKVDHIIVENKAHKSV